MANENSPALNKPYLIVVLLLTLFLPILCVLIEGHMSSDKFLFNYINWKVVRLFGRWVFVFFLWRVQDKLLIPLLRLKKYFISTMLQARLLSGSWVMRIYALA